MKPHVIHSLLSLALFTGTLAYLGQRNFLSLDDTLVYLLILKTAVEAVILIILLVSRFVFAPKTPTTAQANTPRPHPATEPRHLAPISAPSTSRSPDLPRRLRKTESFHSQTERISLKAPDFYQRLAELSESDIGRERWLESVVGKHVVWYGTIVDVQRKGREFLLSLSVFAREETFNVLADLDPTQLISTCRKGTFVMVEGILDRQADTPLVRAFYVHRPTNDPN